MNAEIVLGLRIMYNSPVGMSCILVAVSLLQGTAVTAAGRLNELIAIYNSRDSRRLALFTETRLDSELYKEHSPSKWAEQLSKSLGHMAPMKVGSTFRSTDTSVVAEILPERGVRFGIRIDVGENDARKITGIEVDLDPQHLLLYRRAVFGRVGKQVAWVKSMISETKVPALGVSWSYATQSVHIVEGVKKVGSPELAMTDGLWLVGSNAKAMTAALTALFIEAGKLDWDSKLGDLLRDFPMRESFKSATVEQLMQHLSGLPQDLTLTDADVQRVVGKLKDPVKIRESYAKDILQREPVGAPGEKFSYSNAGYAVLGHILERIAKEPFEKLMEERIFKPLGMYKSKVGMPGGDGMPGGKGQVSGHFMTSAGLSPGVLNGPIVHMGAPAGLGVACRFDEMARLTGWLLSGREGKDSEFLRSDTVKRLLKPLPRSVGAATYASGWAIGEISGIRCYTHMGSEGSFVAVVSFFPKEKLVVSVVTNCGDTKAASNVMTAAVEEWRRAYKPTVDSSSETAN